MNGKQIITIPLQNSEQIYVPQYATFAMEGGRVVMTPCDSDGNPIESNEGEE